MVEASQLSRAWHGKKRALVHGMGQALWLFGSPSRVAMKTCLQRMRLGAIPLLLSVSALSFSLSGDALAQASLEGLRIVSVRGRCLRVVAAGKDLPAQCMPDPSNAVLLNTNYPDGRSGFYVMTDRMVITFSGMGSQQIKIGPDSFVQPVDLILVAQLPLVGSNKPKQLRATGTCGFENATRGRPTKIECKAQTEEGTYSLEFLHDGGPPIISE